MGKRNREQVARVKAGTESLTQRIEWKPQMVQCRVCKHFMPNYRLMGHMEEEHPSVKVKQSAQAPIALPSMKEVMKFAQKVK